MKSFFKLREDNEFCCEECVDDSVYGSVEENFEVTGDEQYEDWDLEEGMTGYSTSNISTQRDAKTYQTRELGKLGYTKRNVKTRSTVGGSGGYSLATRQHSMVSNNTLVKRSPLNQSVDEPSTESIVNEEMHKVSVTVIDPNHTMVSMRKEPIQKTVRVKALDKDNAIHKATQYYKDRGYKIKDHNYIGLAEEVVNELNSDTLQNYKEKAKASADNLTATGQHKKAADRWLNVMKATGKQIDKTTAGIKKALNKEEVETLDELSKSTLSSYAKSAARDAVIKRKIAADFEHQGKRAKKPGMKAASDEISQKYKEKSWKRRDGVDKAIDRLTKEENQIDELNKDTLYSYAKKADKDITTKHNELGDQIRADKSAEANKTSMKINNRDKGLDRAQARLNKEGVAEGSEQEKPIKKSDWFDPTDMRSPEKQKAAYLNHLAAKKKNKNIKEQGVAEAYGRRDAYTRDYQSSISGMGKRQSAAYHADGGANDEGWGNERSSYKPADHPHSVHINGKKWKTFNSQSHAQNVANKIKGATVHRENG